MYHHADLCLHKCRLYFQSGSGNNNTGRNDHGSFRRTGYNHHQKLRLHSCNPDRQTRDNRHLDKPGRPDPSDRLRFGIVGVLLIKFLSNRCILSIHLYHTWHLPVPLCDSSLNDRHHCCAILNSSCFFFRGIGFSLTWEISHGGSLRRSRP